MKNETWIPLEDLILMTYYDKHKDIKIASKKVIQENPDFNKCLTSIEKRYMELIKESQISEKVQKTNGNPYVQNPWLEKELILLETYLNKYNSNRLAVENLLKENPNFNRTYSATLTRSYVISKKKNHVKKETLKKEVIATSDIHEIKIGKKREIRKIAYTDSIVKVNGIEIKGDFEITIQ